MLGCEGLNLENKRHDDIKLSCAKTAHNSFLMSAIFAKIFSLRNSQGKTTHREGSVSILRIVNILKKLASLDIGNWSKRKLCCLWIHGDTGLITSELVGFWQGRSASVSTINKNGCFVNAGY